MSKLLTELRLDSTYLNWLVLFFFVGAIIPVILGWFLRHRLPSANLTMHSRVEAVPYTVTITVLAAGATYYFLENPKLPGGAFFIAVILVLTQVGSEVAWRLTVERVIGTLLGVGLFAVVNQLVGATTFTEIFGLPFPLKLYIIGTLFAVVALMAKFSSVNWLYYRSCRSQRPQGDMSRTWASSHEPITKRDNSSASLRRLLVGARLVDTAGVCRTAN